MEIIKDINMLKTISEPVRSVSESNDIIEKLKNTLLKCDNGVGLAAIQIGINKRISVIKRNNDFFYLINPKIIEANDEFLFFKEGCLSFPGQYYNTYRYKHFIIENNRINEDEFEIEKLYFYYPTDKEDEKFTVDNKIISIAVQHEIDHFDGKILPEYAVKNTPIRKEQEKIGRNDPCPCGSGKKFKKCCFFK